MAFLGALWLPILLSALLVFMASSIMHTVLKYHQADYRRLPDEEKALAGLRGAGLTKGLYVFPYGTHQEMKSPEMQAKYKQGPVGMMTVYPNEPPAMPKFLGQWIGFCLAVSFFVGYLTWHSVVAGANYLVVFRVAGTAAFLAYGLANVSNGIWRGQPWGMVIKEVVDGLIYALLTAGTFGWLWPR